MSSSRIILAAVVLLCFALGFIGGRVASAGRDDLLISSDTDGNGMVESYKLENHQVTVCEDQQMIWESPPDWKIEQILVADADNDGAEELLMVLWKYGSFGETQPFWHEPEDKSYSCHLFMYRLQAGQMRAVWCSSALDVPLQSISVAVSSDNKLSLVIREQSKLPFLYSPSIWQWQHWGFTRV